MYFKERKVLQIVLSRIDRGGKWIFSIEDYVPVGLVAVEEMVGKI